ncbi:MAG: translation initiation factor IF-5A [Candidatus Micrarchaeota archaeon]|nr:translation initiation factor IF-5A [Candidatus Micrarchaeota archaeon]MDE1859731.1 translation initiation factor IF-5A [Candidatus Micrarchaeota archaeon]
MYGSMKEVKPGKFILIDGIPCRVVELDVSSPGKHGAAKMRVTAVGVFDGVKRTLLKPSSADIEVPIINKKKAQVVSITENMAQLMDLESYETYEVPIPEDLKGSMKQGAEVEVMESMGKRAISRVMGSA